ncbi:MAG TPA: DUF177 domain-containing protein [Burkholderiales bacterium]|nr:DUF177 domain-containing protein [Burkholderiales bacterium]
MRGSIDLLCQRCLEPLRLPLAIDAELQLAGSPREILEADDEIDRVLASRHMSIGELVEDEVMLALPMAPRHETCERRPAVI